MKINYICRFWPIYAISAIILLAGTLLASQAVTAIADNTPIPRSVRLVIDAGHGGEDGGAISCTGVCESQINLQISLRLQDLCHLLGYQTVMTRTKDVSIYTQGSTLSQKKMSDLKERVKLVENTDNSILISIHQNSFSQSMYAGAQVFYAPTQGSKELADLLQSNLINFINPGSVRQSKQAASIYLLQHITCPGVLIECGFISNYEEEQKLRSPEYQKILCCIILSGICEYISS